MPKVLLCWMPFGSANNPPLGVGLLKAGLSNAQVECGVKYFSMDFARRVGLEFYYAIAGQALPYRLLVGEWLFTTALFSEGCVDTIRYIDWVQEMTPDFSVDRVLPEVLSAQAQVEPFLDECLESLDCESFDIIGFSSCYQQNIASLALAKRIKELWPQKTILFGGQNVEGVMGVELLRHFDFVDYACLGEGDAFLPEFVRRLRAGQTVQGLPGLAFRQGDQVLESPGHAVVEDLDELRYPDFDDFFQQREAILGNEDQDTYLPFETSRGCWWGERKPCAFCAVLMPVRRYRAKSPQRILDEIEYLKDRYPVRHVYATDFLPPSDMVTYLPRLRNESPRVSLYFYLRANVDKEHLEVFKQAGVDRLFVGIESLSTPILRLMRKGTTALDNIRMLKWCRELDIQVSWLLLIGTPFEDPGEYSRMSELVPSLHHLPPPRGWGELWLYCNSPHSCKPEDFGLMNLRPAEAYTYIYPRLPEEALWNLARCFDFDYADGRDPFSYSEALFEAVETWQETAAESILIYIDDGERLRLFDARPVARQTVHTLSGLERALYLACDSQQSLKRLAHLITREQQISLEGRRNYSAQTKNDNPVQSRNHSQDVLPIAIEEIQPILDTLVSKRLMQRENQSYLSLAVDMGRYLKPELVASIPDEFCLAVVQSLISRVTNHAENLIPQ